MTQDKAERIARQLTASDEDGWDYRAVPSGEGFKIACYDADKNFLGIVG